MNIREVKERHATIRGSLILRRNINPLFGKSLHRTFYCHIKSGKSLESEELHVNSKNQDTVEG